MRYVRGRSQWVASASRDTSRMGKACGSGLKLRFSQAQGSWEPVSPLQLTKTPALNLLAARATAGPDMQEPSQAGAAGHRPSMSFACKWCPAKTLPTVDRRPAPASQGHVPRPCWLVEIGMWLAGATSLDHTCGLGHQGRLGGVGEERQGELLCLSWGQATAEQQ